jgi:hypothetical protein
MGRTDLSVVGLGPLKERDNPSLKLDRLMHFYAALLHIEEHSVSSGKLGFFLGDYAESVI